MNFVASEMTCLVDTNVVLDVVIQDEVWLLWSLKQLQAAADRGSVVINDIIYAELCGRYDAQEQADQVVRQLYLNVVSLPRPALFAAGQAHRRYRSRGGPRDSLLPDFLIGAHAFVEGWTLLSRDPRRYRTDFPGLNVICP